MYDFFISGLLSKNVVGFTSGTMLRRVAKSFKQLLIWPGLCQNEATQHEEFYIYNIKKYFKIDFLESRSIQKDVKFEIYGLALIINANSGIIFKILY